MSCFSVYFDFVWSACTTFSPCELGVTAVLGSCHDGLTISQGRNNTHFHQRYTIANIRERYKIGCLIRPNSSKKRNQELENQKGDWCPETRRPSEHFIPPQQQARPLNTPAWASEATLGEPFPLPRCSSEQHEHPLNFKCHSSVPAGTSWSYPLAGAAVTPAGLLATDGCFSSSRPSAETQHLMLRMCRFGTKQWVPSFLLSVCQQC